MANDIMFDILVDYDVFGASGTSAFAPRRNLLCMVESRSFDDEHLLLKCNLWQPEGFGLENFLKDSLTIT